MRSSMIRGTLITIWMVSWLFCLAVPLYYKRDIPANFGTMIKQTVDTFGPSLAAMIAFVYAGHRRRQRLKKSKVMTSNVFADVLAIVLSLVYAGLFVIIMILFMLQTFTAEETISYFQEFRQYLNFLVTGMVAFYFGSTSESN